MGEPTRGQDATAARRIAHLGPPGTFSEEAAMRHDGDAELLPLATIAEVFEAVSSGRAERGVVPFESTLGGPVPATAELLDSRTESEVCGEIDLPTDHCLVSRSGVSASEVRVVFSHPQALVECRGYLRAPSAPGRTEAIRQHRRRPRRHGAQRSARRRDLLSACSRGQGRNPRAPHTGPPRQHNPICSLGPISLLSLDGRGLR